MRLAKVSPGRPTHGFQLARNLVALWQETTAEAELIEWLNRAGVTDLSMVRRIHSILGPNQLPVLSKTLGSWSRSCRGKKSTRSGWPLQLREAN